MKLKSVQISDYKCVRKSADFGVSDITCLVGKNESGKTAILEALEDFDNRRHIRDEAIPYNNKNAKPEITITFEIGKEELDEIFKVIGFPLQKTISKVAIEIIKTYPNNYTLSVNSKDALDINKEELLRNKQNQISGFYSQITRIYKKLQENLPQIVAPLPQLEFKNIDNFRNQLVQLRNGIQADMQQYRPVFLKDIENLSKGIDEIVNIIADVGNLELLETKIVDNLRKNYIPNFILFSTFDDVFPSQVLLSEATSNELIKDLDVISNLRLDVIRADDISEKIKHKEQLNIRLKEEYQKFWTQDMTNLHVEWDSEKLYFFVKEGDEFYPPSLRSKGKQWHLAFYVRVSARAREKVPNIILIDEPGGYLHAQAQRDVLNKLEDASKTTSIILSTHSPYLININKLNRVKLVLRDSETEGTIISNKIHRGADKESLTPIITAIGLDLSLGLDIAKDNNIIFEGITDYYYLRAFQNITGFNFTRDVHLIPGAGADKLNLLVSLMIGWGFNYCIVLDNDAKGRRTKDTLSKDFQGENVNMTLVSETRDKEIEDLFTKEDFAKYVLKKDPAELPPEMANSQIIKKQDKGYDKVLLAKNFYEQVDNGTLSLSSETKTNFLGLLQSIKNVMF
ncbi:hypothetical protein ES705_27389 [subsurface metagenome]